MNTLARTGILLTNIGTPDAPTSRAVRRYLNAFLSDPRVVELPRIIWWPILQGYILRFRPQRSARLYQKIWTAEGSPLLVYSRSLAAKLTERLQLPVEIGMHYGKPSIQSAMESLCAQSITDLLILPLYPQYSATTTASTVDHVTAVLRTWRKIPSLQIINHYSENPAYIAGLCQSIQQAWQTEGRAPHLLFSFHGIPERYAIAGDPYPDLCNATARCVATALDLKTDEWSIAFQSRLGKTKWLMPYTDQVLHALPKQGITHLQVICPGFAIDCLETLEEICIRGKEQFLAAGGESFSYIPALNDQDIHLDLLEKIIRTNNYHPRI